MMDWFDAVSGFASGVDCIQASKASAILSALTYSSQHFAYNGPESCHFFLILCRGCKAIWSRPCLRTAKHSMNCSA